MRPVLELLAPMLRAVSDLEKEWMMCWRALIAVNLYRRQALNSHVEAVGTEGKHGILICY